jgi:cytochrome c oxidase cbb3-type subunit III
MRKLNIIFTAALLVLLPCLAFAAPTEDKDSYNVNTLQIGLVTLIIVLLFVIGVAANVLRQLSFVYRDKMRASKNNNNGNKIVPLILLLLGVFAAMPAFAEEAAKDATEKVVQVSPYISGIPKTDFYAMMTIIALEVIVLFSLLVNIRILIRLLAAKPETEKLAKAIVRRSFMDRFNKSVSLEKEEAIILDHDYDGIKELDNSLPPWWKYGFYLTIVFAVVYIGYYTFGDGPSSHDEYVEQVTKGDEEVAAYLAKSANNVDENTVTMVTDQAQLGDAKNIFESTCAACHVKDGGGNIGPNLTDDYWLHGGSLKDVFKSIKYGWQDKGMKSWKDDYSPKQIAALASYVKSLHGTHPAAPKAPQGDLFVEGKTAAGAKTSDSTVKAN